LALLAVPSLVQGQAASGARPRAIEADATSAQLDSLVARALEVNPTIRAARQRVDAARARIGPAGTLPDPMLGVGIMNVPVAEPGFGDFMTMKTIAVGQMLPFPGKLSLARQAAERELGAAGARLDETALDVAAEVRQTYFDLAFLDHAFTVLEQNQQLLLNFIQVTESRYGVGTGDQADVLKARVEAARLAEEAVAIAEERRGALARLNALLDRPVETPVAGPAVPDRIARAAVSDSSGGVRFASSALGARLADSPFPPLEVLQEQAIRNNPAVRAHEAKIAAQTARAELARRGHLPDFDLSVQYGQRADRSDMITVMVSAPLPLHRGSRQAQEVTEASAELAALEAEHEAMINDLRAELAERYADLERDRAQLALFMSAIIPQGRAALASATSSFQVGRVDFMTLLENQMTLYDYETAYFRALTDFAKSVAELERIVAAEVLP
jgi:outer membrane protein TolC